MKFFAGCPLSENGSLAGSFASPKYPSNYPDNEKCRWGITVPSGYRVKLVFNEFDTEGRYDLLKIYDGPSNSSGELATVSGRYSSGLVYLSSGSSLWFEFSSDGSSTRRGFHANYTAARPHSGMRTDLFNKVPLHGKCIWRSQVL